MGFKLVSLNLNGIGSVAAKRFQAWTQKQRQDCRGVQEIKAQADPLQGNFDRVADMAGHFHCVQKKGCSGVGLYTRHEPSDVVMGTGNPEFDDEGRCVECRCDKPTRTCKP